MPYETSPRSAISAEIDNPSVNLGRTSQDIILPLTL